MVPSATFSNFYNNLYLGGAYRVNLAGRWTSGRSGPKDVDRSKLDFTKAFLHLPLVEMDVVVKLVDVSPDGFAQNVATGILRGRFRDSLSSPTPLTPGQIYEWNVDMTHTSNRFLKGHRLRVDVAGSCFPLYDRNPNTGGGVRARTARTATQRLHHSNVYPSRITLPVSTAH